MHTLYEYEEIQNKNLVKHIQNNELLHKYFSQSWREVKSSRYCGILNFNNQDYYILPKIAIENQEQNLKIFTYMLMFAYDINLENEDISSCANQEHTLLEVFIQMFAQGLLSELKKGTHKEYILRAENLRMLKGKYLINENLKYNFTKDKIYCEFDEFSEDNPLNKFFLYACKILIKAVKNKKVLKHCELIFDEVSDIKIDISKIDIKFTRMNERYKKSYEIAILLLRHFIPLFNDGKQSFAFLFDMNILFEKFIGNITKSIDTNAKTQTQKDFKDFILKPDIICDNLIIDTKYKIIKEEEETKQSDKYQAFAYGINYGKDVMLLYPKHLEGTTKDLILTLGDNTKELNINKETTDKKEVQLNISCIDLNYDTDNYNEYIEEITTRTKTLIEQKDKK